MTTEQYFSRIAPIVSKWTVYIDYYSRNAFQAMNILYHQIKALDDKDQVIEIHDIRPNLELANSLLKATIYGFKNPFDRVNKDMPDKSAALKQMSPDLQTTVKLIVKRLRYCADKADWLYSGSNYLLDQLHYTTIEGEKQEWVDFKDSRETFRDHRAQIFGYRNMLRNTADRIIVLAGGNQPKTSLRNRHR